MGAVPWSSIPVDTHDVRLVVCDMDGTLLDSSGTIPPSFWPLLDTMDAHGITFAPASGRQYATLAQSFADVSSGLAFIAENGSVVVHDDTVLSTTFVDAATVSRVINAVRAATADGHDLGLVVSARKHANVERRDPAFVDEAATYYVDLAIVDDLDEVDDDVFKLATYTFGDAETTAEEIFAELRTSHQVVVSGQHWIDIMSPEANKGRAVRALQESLGITAAQTVAFGDYLNDLEMIGAADWSFAVRNAHPRIRDAARYLAPTNDEHGVVTVLSRLLDS